MLHFDASGSDEGSISWLASPTIKATYNWIVMDTGNIIPLAPEDTRAPHAGWCASDDPRLVYRDANSAFYGIAIAATDGDVATREAKRSVSALCQHCFAKHAWPVAQVWRIVSHRTQAIYPPGHPLARQRGRKHDPEGLDPAHPVMNTNEIRGMMAALQAAA